MEKYVFNDDQVLTIDIHSLDLNTAKYYLERLLIGLNKNIREVVVIHGYNRGTTLQNFVRKELRCDKIKKRFISLNPGRTSLIIN